LDDFKNKIDLRKSIHRLLCAWFGHFIKNADEMFSRFFKFLKQTMKNNFAISLFDEQRNNFIQSAKKIDEKYSA
jgi:hypothetical protein